MCRIWKRGAHLQTLLASHAHCPLLLLIVTPRLTDNLLPLLYQTDVALHLAINGLILKKKGIYLLKI